MACYRTALITACLAAHSARSATSAQLLLHCSHTLCPAGMGIVEAVGPDVQGFKPGQRVTACPWPTEGGEGTWQQLVVVPAKSLVRGVSKLLGAGCLVSRQHAGSAVN